MLPELHRDPRIPGSLVGTWRFEGREVVLRITPDDATMDDCLSSAARALAGVREVDLRARDVAAKGLLASYNEKWRHYARRNGDGTVAEVEGPALAASDFKGRLTMTCLEALGAACYTVFYDAGGMFHGHSVVITSFDGLLFSDAHAELFG